MITMVSLFLRRRRALKAIKYSVLKSSLQTLGEINDSGDHLIRLTLQAAKATLLLRDQDTRNAQSLFNILYATVKGASDAEQVFLKNYCLYYLAVIRGAHSDCFAHANKAYAIKDARRLREALIMPAPVERNMIGTFVVATR